MHEENKHQKHNEHNHLGQKHHPGRWQQHRRGILRTWVFSILLKEPRNGTEIMNDIELASPGNWRPSPGSMYPLLDQLCKEESISKRDDGRYEITEKGKQELEWPFEVHQREADSPEATLNKLESDTSCLEELNRMDPSISTKNRDKLKAIRDRLTALINAK